DRARARALRLHDGVEVVTRVDAESADEAEPRAREAVTEEGVEAGALLGREARLVDRDVRRWNSLEDVEEPGRNRPLPLEALDPGDERRDEARHGGHERLPVIGGAESRQVVPER